MNCMKCGTEMKTEGVFCPDCLAVMEKYPVNPNVVVRIPYRSTAPSVKKKKKRTLKPEEQVRLLRRTCRWLSVLLAVLILLLVGSVAMILHLSDGDADKIFDFDIGQNYDTEESTGATDGT